MGFDRDMIEDASEGARLGIDIGGTFTDAALIFAGQRFTAKVLTTHQAPDDGVMMAMDRVLGQAGISADRLTFFVHGTTLATNALIERKGARTAMLTTEGFRDVIEVAHSYRFDLYDLDIDLPSPLVPRALRFPVRERIGFDGRTLTALNERDVVEVAERLRRTEVAAVAVCLLHSYVNPAHEQRIREILDRELPGIPVSLSSEVAPEMREYERFSTTCANAYVQPRMANYLQRLVERLRERGLRPAPLMMLSGGGLTSFSTASAFPIRLVESGPAGGAVFAAAVARENGLDQVVSFDMGGTTAKICMIENGRPQTSRSFEVARVYRFKKGSGLPVNVPVIEMVEIGAGGGSIARVDSLGRIAVGPDSAGSEPGPAAYGNGGTLPTVTDADFVLGHINPDGFAGGKFSLDMAASREAMEREVGRRAGLDVEEAAAAVLEVVEETMASAARVHAIESGKSIVDGTLIAFGGAAPLHVASIMRKLGMKRFLVPAAAGVGSAVGFLFAPVAYEIARSVHRLVTRIDAAELNAILQEMKSDATALVRAAAPHAELVEYWAVSMRYAGQGHEVTIAVPPQVFGDDVGHILSGLFLERYREIYGREVSNGAAEMLSWSVLVSTTAPHSAVAQSLSDRMQAGATRRREIFDKVLYKKVSYAIHWRPHLPAGALVAGPAIIEEDETSTLVPVGMTATVLASGALLCVEDSVSEDMIESQESIDA